MLLVLFVLLISYMKDNDSAHNGRADEVSTTVYDLRHAFKMVELET